MYSWVVEVDRLIIDGKNLLYRAAWVHQNLHSEGFPTGGIYGFLRSILQLSGTYEARVEVCWEGSNNWRYEAFPEYKSKRKKAAKSANKLGSYVSAQTPVIKEILGMLGIPQWYPEVGECDDALAARSKGDKRTIIVTGDRDLYQVLNEKCAIVRSDSKHNNGYILITEHDVINEVGVTCKQIPDFKALAGDPSDNIPGLPRVGKVRASRLLKEHETLGNLVDAAKAGTLKDSKLADNVIANIDNLYLYKRLATVDTDTPVKKAEYAKPDEGALFSALEGYDLAYFFDDGIYARLQNLGAS